MSLPELVPDVLLIDSLDTMRALIGEIRDLHRDPPSLYFDVEGANLSRDGTIAIISLFVHPHHKTYLIDVNVLGQEGFLVQDGGTSLKSLFESPDIPKVCFDIRNDNDALYGLFGIEVQGIIDIQLLQLASRSHPGNRLSGLASCIRNDSTISTDEKQQWEETKNAGVNLFAPEKGGSYEVFDHRPMSLVIARYCANDVKFLPELFNVYRSKTVGFWRFMIRSGTAERIRDSRGADYNASGDNKAAVPWRQGVVRRRKKVWEGEFFKQIATDHVFDENDQWKRQQEVPNGMIKAGIMAFMSLRDDQELYDGVWEL